MRWLRLVIALSWAVMYLLTTGVVALGIAAPDTAPSLISATMYRHAIQLNDRYLIAKYNMDYTTNPDDPISVTFLARLVEGVTELGACSPYAYRDSGYNRGVFAIYWSADDPNIPTWGSSNYTLRLEGNPTMVWTPAIPLATLSSASFDWETSISIGATSTLIGEDVEAVAQELSDYWSVSLLTPVAGSTTGVNGNVFTASGEAYFTNAIPGLRSIAPNLFAISVEPLTHTDLTHPQTRASALAARRASLGLYEGSVAGVSTDVIYAFISVVIAISLGAVVAAALAPMGGAVSQVGGGVVGVCLALAFVPLLAVYVGTLAAVVEGVLAFVATITIGLWMGTHLSKVL